jgi:uncharacterized membrane protein
MDGGMTAAVQAMIAASKGEYKGTGRTQAEQQRGRPGGQPVLVAFLVMGIFVFVLISLIRRGLRGGGRTVFVNPRRRIGPVIISHNDWWNGGGLAVAEGAAVFPAAAAASAAAAREENGDMKPSHFIQQLDHPRIEAAIAAAEAKTSGEIRVMVHHRPIDDAVSFARAEFLRLGMEKTRDRNGVLLFIAPAAQAFAIIGDEGVHRKCGDAFWSELAATMQAGFRRADYTGALLEGIERAGALLAAHFPPRPDDTNELPNQVLER